MGLDWAVSHAEALLSPLADRWTHTQAVVRGAREVQIILPEAERECLVAAAYLHDVGYSPELVRFGFHPLDGALHLRELGQERLASLVAYHSASPQEAQLRGLSDQLAKFDPDRSDTALALTYCDITTGPTGSAVTLNERFSDLRQQYGDKHVTTQAVRMAWPVLVRCVEQVEAKLGGAAST